MFKIQVDRESRDFRQGSLWALTGFALQILGSVANIPFQEVDSSSSVGFAATVTGTFFCVVSVFYLARSKNRSPGWAILGLISMLGWILVAFLEDRSPGDDLKLSTDSPPAPPAARF